MCTAEAERYDRGMKLLEVASLRRLRAQLLRTVSGRVLEVGTGTGANLPVYAEAARVVGIDINPERLAATAVRRPPFPFTATVADAQQLPFAAHSFDSVVGTLVFCSIPQPAQALQEIRRVLRPNGRLYLLEHVRGQNTPMRLLTDALHPLWFALQGECHLNRETGAVVAENGFRIEQSSVHGWGVLQMMTAVPRRDSA